MSEFEIYMYQETMIMQKISIAMKIEFIEAIKRYAEMYNAMIPKP